MYNQVIVVEGKHDEQKIKSIFPDVDCIVTNGSSISEETLNLIFQTSLHREVILFLDPDFPGKKITNRILETNGDYKIAFISKQKAISGNGKKVGIEHASKEDILESIESYFSIKKDRRTITTNDLISRKLIHFPESRNRREMLCKSLNIPVLNGKSLLRMMNMLDIDLEGIDSLIEL
ncbi:MAG: ribonuclease M5 [Bacilli bacterium]|nr:ribonuclease M5 [Bacilli bacterium]